MRTGKEKIILIKGAKKLAEYHVGCGVFGIYAGTLNPKNKNLWQNKSEVTDEAINAVRDYMILALLGGMDCPKGQTGAYEWDGSKGTIELRVTVKKESKKDETLDREK